MINDELVLADFSFIQMFDDVDDKWFAIKTLILDIINSIAPVKKFRLKKQNMLPWINSKIIKLIVLRDKLHSKALKTTDRESEPWKNFRVARNHCKSEMRKRMAEYFKDKTSSFFGSGKKFWSFYRATVQTKKSSTSSSINNIKLANGSTITDSAAIANNLTNS